MSVFLERHLFDRFRRPPSTATILAAAALFVSLSGVAYAAATIGSAEVVNNSLQSVDLKDGAGVKGIDVVNDSLTGLDVQESSLDGVGRKLIYSAVADTSAPRTTLGAVAGYTFKAACVKAPYHTTVVMYANGPAGDLQGYTWWRVNDDPDPNVETGEDPRGSAIPASSDTVLLGFTLSGNPGGTDYVRGTGTTWIHSGANLLKVDVHALLDLRSGSATNCTVYAMVTKGV
jgi:hypothetical protein